MFIPLRTIFLLFGDILLLYLALAVTLFFRYGSGLFSLAWADHLKPFSLLFLLWILVFYLADFYQAKTMKNALTLFRTLTIAIAASALLSITFFYLFTPFFQLTPKTNLVLFAIIFGVFSFAFRLFLSRVIISRYARTPLLILGDSPPLQEAVSELHANLHLGYDLAHWLKDNLHTLPFERLRDLIVKQRITLVIIEPHLMKHPAITKLVYRLLPLHIDVMSANDFVELVFRKVSLDNLEEDWFIANITSRHLYDPLKRFLDIVLAFFFLILTSPFMLISALLIALTSEGPVLYRQKRIGIGGVPFTLYKFRTMFHGAQGPLWTTSGDRRITPVGKLLRATHLDEFPQLYNILRGDLSFVGPRPERLELAKQYQQLPHYDMRHIIKPGLTGWAQINFRPSASLEEAYEKLKHDMYYIKNRSFFLDVLIILKTVRYFFMSHH